MIHFGCPSVCHSVTLCGKCYFVSFYLRWTFDLLWRYIFPMRIQHSRYLIGPLVCRSCNIIYKKLSDFQNGILFLFSFWLPNICSLTRLCQFFQQCCSCALILLLLDVRILVFITYLQKFCPYFILNRYIVIFLIVL